MVSARLSVEGRARLGGKKSKETFPPLPHDDSISFFTQTDDQPMPCGHWIEISL